MSKWRDGDYPTRFALQRIQKWDCVDDGAPESLLAFIRDECWWMPEWGWEEKRGVYWISTGGWSGNEEIIGALRQNSLFWSLCFISMRTGGHYTFATDKDSDWKVCGRCHGSGVLFKPTETIAGVRR